MKATSLQADDSFWQSIDIVDVIDNDIDVDIVDVDNGIAAVECRGRSATVGRRHSTPVVVETDRIKDYLLMIIMIVKLHLYRSIYRLFRKVQRW